MGVWNQYSIRSYQDANRFYNEHKTKHWPTVNLYYGTRLHRDVEGDAYHLIHHGSTIIDYYKNGVIHINNCGYYTKTTKDRLNLHLPSRFRVWQKNYDWFITIYPSADDPNWVETTIPYRNGFLDSWLVLIQN